MSKEKVEALLEFLDSSMKERRLHVWENASEDEQEVFLNFMALNFEGRRIEPVGNQYAIPARNISRTKVHTHKTFLDAVRAISENVYHEILEEVESVKHYHFIASTFTLANHSKARRRACGALLVRNDPYGIPTIVSSGINGTPPKHENLCEDHLLTQSAGNVVHAEVNCIGAIAETFDTDILYITDSPCPDCLAYLRHYSKVRTVVYAREYRITDHLVAATDFKFIHVDADRVREYLESSISRSYQAES